MKRRRALPAGDRSSCFTSADSWFAGIVAEEFVWSRSLCMACDGTARSPPQRAAIHQHDSFHDALSPLRDVAGGSRSNCRLASHVVFSIVSAYLAVRGCVNDPGGALSNRWRTSCFKEAWRYT